jgi:hypothetical protein
MSDRPFHERIRDEVTSIRAALGADVTRATANLDTLEDIAIDLQASDESATKQARETARPDGDAIAAYRAALRHTRNAMADVQGIIAFDVQFLKKKDMHKLAGRLRRLYDELRMVGSTAKLDA